MKRDILWMLMKVDVFQSEKKPPANKSSKKKEYKIEILDSCVFTIHHWDLYIMINK